MSKPRNSSTFSSKPIIKVVHLVSEQPLYRQKELDREDTEREKQLRKEVIIFEMAAIFPIVTIAMIAVYYAYYGIKAILQ